MPCDVRSPTKAEIRTGLSFFGCKKERPKNAVLL